MNDYFYYIGSLYILWAMRSLILFFVQGDDDYNALVRITKIDEQKDHEQFLEMGKEAHGYNKSIKGYWTILVSGMFFIWALVGFMKDTPEKYLFLTDIILSVSLMFIGMCRAMLLVFSGKPPEEKVKRLKAGIPVIPIINIMMATLILISHSLPEIFPSVLK